MSSPKYTPQQQAILEAQGTSVGVSAGAGCGKTFVLARRFLNFLEPAQARANPLSRIVAITFTEKAAREMRHRVRLGCQAELLRCGPEEVPHWLEILRGLDTARVSTIHAFCATLLRTYAVEAGLDPGFQLLDPSFGNAFLSRSVEETLCRLVETNDVDAAELVFQFGYERTVRLLEELLSGAKLADRTTNGELAPSELIEIWQRAWATECLPLLLSEFRESPTVRRVTELLNANVPQHAKMRTRCAAVLELLAAETWSDSSLMLIALRENATVQGGGRKSGVG